MFLSQSAARALMLAAQGLDKRPAEPATKWSLLATIRRMHALQIDTISVVARSHYLVLWSRIGSYRPEWLDELLPEGKLFEYWSHAACFIPIEDYPLYRRRMLDATLVWRGTSAWLRENQELVGRVLGQIREHGEVLSSDFERTDGQPGGWWNWKPEKTALEVLHTRGDLMIRRRERFQRVYDLRERVLPNWDDSQAPPMEAVQDRFALMAVYALGVTKAEWVPKYFGGKKTGNAALLTRLVHQGSLLQVEVEGWKSPGYLHPENLPLAQRAAAGDLQPELTTLLSPFDPITRDRALAREMFGFDYMIECYTPAAKRRYGYFSLPILRRGSLVGRLDAKAHRKGGLFEVKALHLEPGVNPDHALVADLAGAIQECAVWHGTPQAVVRQSDPVAAAGLINRSLSAVGI